MNLLRKNQLVHAYLQARFSIEVTPPIEICAILDNKSLETLLKSQNIKCWAIVTSDNPYSNELSDAENDSRRARLEAEIQKLGLRFIKSYGRDPEDKWKPEIGFFIFNIALNAARKLGEQFEQNAIVFGDSTSTAEIVWLVE